MKYIFFLIFIFFISCNSKEENSEVRLNLSDEKKNSLQEESKISNKTETNNIDTELIEIFSDSLNIGKKGECKIELIKYRILDDIYVIVKFYSKGTKYWYIKNKYFYDCTSLRDFAVNISDFNNDKLNDITFISATAARGANEVRRLFIYDDTKKELISIVNSEDYPNMKYNNLLDCIDAFMVHGTSTTVFAKLSGDSLKTFANVQNSEEFHTINLIDNNGKKRELYRVKSKGVYIKHKNFKPLIEYEFEE